MGNSQHKLYIDGMHCKACIIVVQDAVKQIDGTHDIQVNLKKQIVCFDCEDISTESLANKLNNLINTNGYKVSATPTLKQTNRLEYIVALVISLGLIFGFVQLQKLGLLQLLDAENRTYATSFIIGLIASISSCLAVVGGLVLALGTIYADTRSMKQHWLFHIGRLAGFFVLGGVLGMLGSTFQMSQITSIILNIIIAIVLLLLGLNLLGITKHSISFGGNVFKKLYGKDSSFVGPLLVGIATFFLPCGFTQSMQIYTLSTGDFISGGLTMLAFAFGTFPVLLLLSLTGRSVSKFSSSSLLFKIIGMVLVVLSIYNLSNSMVVLGIMDPLFSF